MHSFKSTKGFRLLPLHSEKLEAQKERQGLERFALSSYTDAILSDGLDPPSGNNSF